LSSFEKAWAIVKGYEPPTMTSAGEKWLGEKGYSLMDEKQPIRSFRNLRRQWRDKPMMSMQLKLRSPEGRMTQPTTIATSSTVPLDEFTRFTINEKDQAKAFNEGVRNKHAYAGGMTSRDIIDQMLFDSANPQDLLDYDVEYNKRGMPVVMDREGQPAPLASYWPYDYKDGQRTPNKHGGFVLTQMNDVNENPQGAVKMRIPNHTGIDEVSVITPYGAAFPNKDAEELMREIGGTRI